MKVEAKPNATAFRSELGWRQIEMRDQSSLSYQFAHYALGLQFEMLPRDVVHTAKRCLLDALGCAIGAWDAPGRPICEAAVKELGGKAEATVIGSGLLTSASNANLVNSFLVRFLDFNDLGGGGHNSDAIPSILAVAEREKSNGRELLTSLVISYELGSRVAEAVTDWNGWVADTRASLTTPPSIGRLMGMNAEQIANAMGICASGNMVLGVLDTPGEERVMRKNLRFGWCASAAIMATLLARRGFTGPVRVLEGERGLNEVLFRRKVDFAPLTDFRHWHIRRTRFKNLCANVSLQGLLQATIELVKENDLRPEDIASVRIKMSPGANAIRPSVPIKYPRAAETADHSAFFLAAVAIKDREMTADSVLPEKFTDPVILELIEKISVEGDASIPAQPKLKYQSSLGFDGKCEIVTTDGRNLKKHIAIPHGFWDGPNLTDAELEAKFRRNAGKHMSGAKIDRLIEAIWKIDELADVGELMRLTAF